MESSLKTCKKCGKPIYSETFFINANKEDGFCYHEQCLKNAGFVDNGAGFLKNNSKVYQISCYTTLELRDIALEMFSER